MGPLGRQHYTWFVAHLRSTYSFAQKPGHQENRSSFALLLHGRAALEVWGFVTGGKFLPLLKCEGKARDKTDLKAVHKSPLGYLIPMDIREYRVCFVDLHPLLVSQENKLARALALAMARYAFSLARY